VLRHNKVFQSKYRSPGDNIRTIPDVIQSNIVKVKTHTFKSSWRRFFRPAELVPKKAVRYGLVALNVVILLLVIYIWRFNTLPNQKITTAALSTAGINSHPVNPLDQTPSADIAETVAVMANLPEQTAVRNQSETVQAELAITPAENVVVAKPQVVATALKSRSDIQTYEVQTGDTINSLAVKFGITANSITWSNSLSGTSLKVGSKLVIPPINSIVYTVKAGDTPQKLASTYSASADQIISFNDAELSGLTTGEQIVIPNGQEPVVVTLPTYNLYNAGAATYGGDGYDYGYCTYWVAMRRIQVGKPLPNDLGNASSWGYLAHTFGLSTGNTPQQYAAVVLSMEGEGHVGFVESVNSDGSINISEMNATGWDRVDYRTIPVNIADSYIYVY
jgi:surface antigen